ncbi:MAG: CvpA family protein [Acidobacteria bacterium]|nr:CvpA family protein [Acidobacteriota bacterium]
MGTAGVNFGQRGCVSVNVANLVNWFDLTLAFFVLFYVIAGIAKGFGRSAIGFLTFLTALGCALWFYGPLGFWLRSYIQPPVTAHAVGFVAVFFGVLVLGGVLEKNVGHVVREAHLGALDRFLGGCFGVAQGALTAGVIALGILAFGPKPLPQMVMRSRFAPEMANAAVIAARSAPDEVREGFDRARRDLKKVLPEKVQTQLDQLGSSSI